MNFHRVSSFDNGKTARSIRLDSPKDLSSLSKVSSLFLSVVRDDRIWKRLCHRLYHIQPSSNEMNQSFYDLFTKILVPYGRYLGYWKSDEQYFGGLIHVHLNIADGTIIAEKLYTVNTSFETAGHVLVNDEEEEEDEADEFSFKPLHVRTKLFDINSLSGQIFCYLCKASHQELPWIKTFNSDEQYFGLSLEALPGHERSSLLAHDHKHMEGPEGHDIYFTRQCSSTSSVVYHPLSISPSTAGDYNHPLSRFNGLWIGSYGGHGLELLHLELCSNFTCPTTIDGRSKDAEIVPYALVARKISGDPNVPHSQISFAAVHPLEVESDSPISYEGIGQIAHTGYIDAQFIRTKIVPVSENVLKVTWFALHHTSCFQRCSF